MNVIIAFCTGLIIGCFAGIFAMALCMIQKTDKEESEWMQ